MLKNYSALTIGAVVLIVILIGSYFFVLKESTYAPTSNTVTVIETPEDLDEADSQLEEDSDFEMVDSSLSELDSELSKL
jgi:hypothetical protein